MGPLVCASPATAHPRRMKATGRAGLPGEAIIVRVLGSRVLAVGAVLLSRPSNDRPLHPAHHYEDEA